MRLNSKDLEAILEQLGSIADRVHNNNTANELDRIGDVLKSIHYMIVVIEDASKTNGPALWKIAEELERMNDFREEGKIK